MIVSNKHNFRVSEALEREALNRQTDECYEVQELEMDEALILMDGGKITFRFESDETL